MNKRFKLTKQGVDELNSELKELKQRRIEIAEKLQIARDYGDLSENAEYHSARDEQAIVEVRIKEINHILQNVELIKNGKNHKVDLGSTVILEKGRDQLTFTLVGSVEANPNEGKISNESPIGQALMGKTVNDEVDINTPSGLTVYKVKTIS